MYLQIFQLRTHNANIIRQGDFFTHFASCIISSLLIISSRWVHVNEYSNGLYTEFLKVGMFSQARFSIFPKIPPTQLEEFRVVE